jgi:hypothetical protein
MLFLALSESALRRPILLFTLHQTSLILTFPGQHGDPSLIK